MKNTSFVMMAAAVMLVSAACKKAEGAGGASGKRPAGAQVYAVTTVVAQKGQINSFLTLAGDLVAGSSVDAYSEAAGKVIRVNVNVGSRVTQGQPIALVDPSKPGMNYVAYTVRAPITGTITALPAEVGMTISQSVSLAKIAGGGGLEIALYVPERFISRVKRGLPCEINLDAYPGEIFRGIVNEISPTVDPNTRTETIKINVDNPGSRLKAGMFAKVSIVTESRNDAISVPSGAIVTRQDKSVVFVVAPGTEPNTSVVRQVEVVMGIQSEGFTELSSGVSEGDEIVDKGMSLLSDGARINIINSADAGEQTRS